MTSSRLFWRLFGTSVLVLPATALIFVVLASRWHREQTVEQIDVRLHDIVVAVRASITPLISEGPSNRLREFIRQLGDETQTRLTVISPDGVVLANSQESPTRMENHKDRVEFIQAAARGQGTSQRTSPTLKVPMRYFAMRVDQDSERLGLLRAALPVDETESLTATLRPLLWMAGLFGTLIGSLLGYWNSKRVLTPIRELIGAADRLAEGSYGDRVQITSRDEIGELADAFNKMCRGISTRENQLRETADQLATVLAGMADGVLAIDTQQRVLFANRAAGELLGFSDQDVSGQPLWEVVRNHLLHEVAASALRDEQAGGQDIVAAEITAGADRKCVLAVNAARLPGSPCPGIVLVLHDVTELRRLENLRQQFVANVSHELKTPLSSIMAYSETLRQGAIDDPSVNRRFVENIHDQSNRLQDLIMDMLQLARIESGERGFEVSAVSLVPGVSRCVANHRESAAAKGIQLSLEDGHDREIRVRADEEGLRQIVDNLVDNAIKYTPDGGQVTVRCRRDEGTAVIEVEDTGIGIPALEQDRVFERFYRVDKARSRHLGSTGLGLSIVKHLSQSLGGTVQLTSRVGKGSVFTVRLPAE